MSTQPKDEILDLGDPDNDLAARERFHDHLRAAGIRPATDWEWADLEMREPYRPGLDGPEHHDFETLDLFENEDNEEREWRRFRARLRAMGIRPATEWQVRTDRIVFRKPFSLRSFILRTLGIRDSRAR